METLDLQKSQPKWKNFANLLSGIPTVEALAASAP